MDTEADDFEDCPTTHKGTMSKNAPSRTFVAPTPRQHTAARKPLSGGLRAEKAKALGVRAEAQRRKGSTPVKNTGKKVVVAQVEEDEERKKHKYRPATIAERKVKKEQKEVGLMCRKLPMSRLIRECSQEATTVDSHGEYYEMRFTKAAMANIHEAAEDYVTHVLAQVNTIADHAGRCTVYPEDFRALKKLNQMRSGGVLHRNVYRAQNADGTTGKIVLIGSVPKLKHNIGVKG